MTHRYQNPWLRRLITVLAPNERWRDDIERMAAWTERAPDEFRLKFRACRSCLAVGFHSQLFQLRWLDECPLHGELLRSPCQVCEASFLFESIDTQTPPFTCPSCGAAFCTYDRLFSAIDDRERRRGENGEDPYKPIRQLAERSLALIERFSTGGDRALMGEYGVTSLFRQGPDVAELQDSVRARDFGAVVDAAGCRWQATSPVALSSINAKTSLRSVLTQTLRRAVDRRRAAGRPTDAEQVEHWVARLDELYLEKLRLQWNVWIREQRYVGSLREALLDKLTCERLTRYLLTAYIERVVDAVSDRRWPHYRTLAPEKRTSPPALTMAKLDGEDWELARWQWVSDA